MQTDNVVESTAGEPAFTDTRLARSEDPFGHIHGVNAGAVGISFLVILLTLSFYFVGRAPKD